MSFEEGSTEWMNPPPPGTVDDHYRSTSKEKYPSQDRYEKDYRQYSESPARSHDGIHRRSRSNDRYSKNTRERRRRSRSRDYRRRRSRSGSRKRYDRRHTHKYRSRYSRSRSRSHSRRHRRSYSRSRSPSSHRRRSRSRSWSSSSNSDRESYNRRHRMIMDNQEYTRKVYSKRADENDDDEEIEPVQENTFKNDGSFLEMFKKMQEEQAKQEIKEEPETSGSELKKPTPIFGKRRGGRILKTGMVQKVKNPNEVEEEPKDAWSVYMKEVRKYKEACCDDDSKTRPLVK